MPAPPIPVSGPLEAFAAGFARELSRQGYTANSAAFQLRLMAHVSRWLAGEGLDLCGLGASAVERFRAARRAAGYTQYLSAKALDPLLTYLRALGMVAPPHVAAPTDPVEIVLERYRHYLAAERGLRQTTIRGYDYVLRPFLRECVSAASGALDLTKLRARDVIAFVCTACPQHGRGTAQLTVTALRSLLGFLAVEGVIPGSLVAAVPAGPRRVAGLPKGLEPAAVQRLLAACDRRTRTGRRDVAILTMLVRLGLRAGELAALQLDDIDWRSGEIVLVHGKGGRADRLPLPADVGAVVAAYLRHGRPATALDRTVFVRVHAPHRGLSSTGVTAVVAAAARRAGLGRIHAHRLRHTAATQLLRAGASLPEIGQLLGHHRAATTAIYAKVDRDALRTIARPWPGGGV